MSSSSSASGAAPPAVQLAYPGEYLSDAAWRWSAKAGHRGSQRHSEADDAWTDKAGGACMWHAELPAPPTEATECKLCGGPLYLLTQLYLPSTAAAAAGRLPAHLYVLACNKVACALSGKEGCWRALKLVVNDAEEGAAPNPALQGRVAAAPSHAIAAEAAAAPAPAPAQAAQSPPPKAAASASAVAASASSKKAASSSSAAAPAAAASKPAPAAPAKAESDEDEWGAKAAWSDDEDSSATKKTKGKGKAAVDDDDDDDAVLTALLAKQSLQQEANRAAKAAAAEKADKAAAARAAKAARKEEMRAQATQELMEAALEARRKAEADGTASAASAAAAASSSAAAPTAAAPAASQPPPTCFRPFYLAWCPEPAPSAPEHSREMRLLREYEARMAEEGEESELAALRGAQNGGAPGELSATGLSTDEEEEEDAVERRDDDTQAFFDRVDRLRDQCVRYYEPQPAAATAAGSSVVPAAVTQGVYSTRAELAFRDGVSRNPALRCAHCRSVRQLEVQLMPKLLWEMRTWPHPRMPVLL